MCMDYSANNSEGNLTFPSYLINLNLVIIYYESLNRSDHSLSHYVIHCLPASSSFLLSGFSELFSFGDNGIPIEIKKKHQ